MKLCHDTLTIQRQMTASPEKVFRAYHDPSAREIWCVPSETGSFKIQTANVKSGGQEIAKCGPTPKHISADWDGSDLPWEMRLNYHTVLEPNLIIFSEELYDGDVLLTIALVTFEFQANPSGTLLTLTDQITSLAGRELIDDHKSGYDFALAQLSSYVDQKQFTKANAPAFP